MGRKKEENLEINREIRIIQNEEEEGYFRETQKKEEFTMEEDDIIRIKKPLEDLSNTVREEK